MYHTDMEVITKKDRFLMVSIIPQYQTDEEVFKELKELKSLVTAAGGKVIDIITQQREMHDKGSYIGRGKVNEITRIVAKLQIDVVVLNGRIKSGQLFELKKNLEKNRPGIIVWDRIDLILEIFSRQANTAEAKLQIKLAAMRHMGPRIYGMGMVLSRQSGGIGTRGIGETNTELMERHWREQIRKVQNTLQKLTTERTRQLERRQRLGFKTASIIGYTNAGKTSLFNLLSGKKKLVKNALFATLDSSVGKLYLPDIKKEILLSDTIGFIHNLPASLIDAFTSTLMESIHADILLHVIDITDDNMRNKIAVVEDILYDLRISAKKRIYVFNKIDRAENVEIKSIAEEYQVFTPQFISTEQEIGITALVKSIAQAIENSVSIIPA